ncbi:hypothetical protein AA313_de0202364 [Arthrobotrys entomopaga]|nr:hypothetical protein AA313_de0202364 [Arthrobotrys entomopaga]
MVHVGDSCTPRWNTGSRRFCSLWLGGGCFWCSGWRADYRASAESSEYGIGTRADNRLARSVDAVDMRLWDIVNIGDSPTTRRHTVRSGLGRRGDWSRCDGRRRLGSSRASANGSKMGEGECANDRLARPVDTVDVGYWNAAYICHSGTARWNTVRGGSWCGNTIHTRRAVRVRGSGT